MIINKLFKLRILKNYRNSSNITSSTIFAHSSGHGKCGVAVIRISGTKAGDILKHIAKLDQLPKPRHALLKNIINPNNNEVIDKGIVLWFPGPKSFTGEDSCELQVHGSLAVIRSILNMLSTFSNVRLANPGEFTKRAFINGKLDLTEVEGLADLLQAETEAQRKQAFLQSQGSLSKLYKSWSRKLTENLAHFEGYIDFHETDTLDDNLLENVTEDIKKLTAEINKHLEDGRKGERLRSGVRTVILGSANVGKSSLLNALCQRPAAIVTPIEGTTRDVLEVMLDIEGYPLILADTAGLRKHTADIVEMEGISRALGCYEEADLILLVIDSVKYEKFINENSSNNLSHFIQYYVSELGLKNFFNADGTYRRHCIVIMNKIDLASTPLSEKIPCISCKTKTGLTELLTSIEIKLQELCGDPSLEHPCMNQARHKENLSCCLECLRRFLDNDVIDTAIHAEYLRKALHYLGYLTGKVTTEQILDIIFRDFCIGK